MNIIYIQRRLLEKEQYYQYDEHYPFLGESSLNLYSLITQGTKRAILLGDAGYGKSTELKAISRKFFKERNPNFVPVYIPLDTYTDEEIEEYVNLKIGKDSIELLEYSKSKLVFLFDEFDQVREKGKTEKKIQNFVEQYKESTFIIACRTNFYSGQFPRFKNVVLLPFDQNEIKSYTISTLGNQSDNFLQDLIEKSVFELAKNPFFLNHLVGIYKKDKQIPRDRVNIFSRIVSLSLENDTGRLAEYDLKQNYPIGEIEADLMYMSIIMETLQRNFISIEEFNVIFSDSKKREIISKLSLIKKSFFKKGDAFQFQHNNFQEFLAAKNLTDKDFETVLAFISYSEEKSLTLIDGITGTALKYIKLEPFGIKVGRIISDLLKQLKRKLKHKRIDRINASWINTITFLCQLRSHNDLNDLFDYLSRYEPELTFKFEKNRIDREIQEKLFKAVFKKYTDKKIPLGRRINYDEMANFAETKNIYSYLMNFARSKKHYTHRYNAIQMLGRMQGMGNGQLQRLLIQHAKNQAENINVRHICLYALSWLGMNNVSTINNLMELKDSSEDTVLAGFYYLISKSIVVDDYVDVLLNGIKKAETSTLMEIKWHIERGIARVQSVEKIKRIVEYFVDNPQHLRQSDISGYVNEIMKNAIKAYDTDASIYDDIKGLAMILDKNDMKGAVSKTKIFFQKTQTVFRFFKEIYELHDENNYPLLTFVANEQCIGFLINEYQKKQLSDVKMRNFIYSLEQTNKDKFEEFITKINQETGKFFPEPPKDYEQMQKDKLKRKIQIIFDVNEYIKEVKSIFNGENRKDINYDELYNIRSKQWREEKYNGFVITDLIKYLEHDRNKKWTLINLIAEIKKWNYEWLTMTQIFGLLKHNTEIELSDGQTKIVENFCLKNLANIDFKTALKSKGKEVSTKQLAVLLWYFLRKFNFSYPEAVLLDMLSFDWFEGHSVGMDYLVNQLALDKVRERVIANIKEGIEVNDVLNNHVEFCRTYHVQEVKEQLCDLVKDTNINTDSRLLALETVVGFGNSTEFLESLLDIEELEIFKKTASILVRRNNKKAIKKLVRNLKAKNEELALSSALILIGKQDIRGIRFYANYVKMKKELEVKVLDKSPLTLIKTTKALPILFDLLKFYYANKQEIKQEPFGTLDDIIINALKTIGLQSSRSVRKVLKSISKFIKKHGSRPKDVNFLHIVYDDIEYTFYLNYSAQLALSDAKAKVDRLIS